MVVSSHAVPSVRVRTKRPRTAGARSPRRRGVLQILLVFAGCVILLDAVVGEKGLVEMRRVRGAHQELQRRLADIRAENARLAEEIRRLESDPAAIEDAARRELGFIRPGEKIFTVRDRQPDPQRTAD